MLLVFEHYMEKFYFINKFYDQRNKKQIFDWFFYVYVFRLEKSSCRLMLNGLSQTLSQKRIPTAQLCSHLLFDLQKCLGSINDREWV